MQTNPTRNTSSSFQFRFISVLASQAEDQIDSATEASHLKELNELGKEGWQIRGMTPDPQLPAARLLIVLQREIG